jgi:acyl CoA:acetate/3-ketoacid CoA transferase alpha subunit/acyl CoA:acetate/3-ketoacid CoA transferase beta subunit
VTRQGAGADEALLQRFAMPIHEGSSKQTDLSSAITQYVKPGMTVHIAYSDARPNAAILELARTFAGTDPRFTLVTAGLVNVQHSLIELGLVSRIVASFAGENYPVARPNPALVRALREGCVTIEHWSLWSLVARLVGGALGVPYFPVKSLAGSTMGQEAAARGEYLELRPEPGAGPAGFVKSLRPDIVLLHAAAADRHGNAVLSAPYGEGHWGSLASRGGVIVSAERIVSTAELREMNTLAKIPGHVVRAVCEVPFGAHPYGLNSPGVSGVSSYSEDEPFVANALTASRTPEGFRAWIDEWVLGVASHEDYNAKVGPGRFLQLIENVQTDHWQGRVTDSWMATDPATPAETQVVVTARRLEHAVRDRGFDVVLAGVGLANLAAWTGAEHLRRQGIDVELMAEIGLYGYLPRPGEPFIFAGQNVPTNKVLTDVMGVLGTFVSGPGSASIGVIGAGQIDQTGAINSTYGADGDFIVGSGGANDVLSAADEVIITVGHQPGRLVAEVSYVTCPGSRVRTIVTDLAVFERGPQDLFVLTALLPAAGATIAEGLERVRDRTGWEFDTATEVAFEPPPSPSELETLRVFDPALLFLRDRREYAAAKADA